MRLASFVVAFLTLRLASLVVAVLAASYLTRAVAYYGLRYGIFLSYAIVATAGSTTAPQLAPAWNLGVFAGMAGMNALPNFAWFTSLAFAAAAMWIVFFRFKILLGFGGRLGTAVFISQNLVMAALVCPAGGATWSIYYDDDRNYTSCVTWQKAATLGVASCTAAITAFNFRRLAHSMTNPVTVRGCEEPDVVFQPANFTVFLTLTARSSSLSSLSSQGANVSALILMLIVTSVAEVRAS